MFPTMEQLTHWNRWIIRGCSECSQFWEVYPKKFFQSQCSPGVLRHEGEKIKANNFQNQCFLEHWNIVKLPSNIKHLANMHHASAFYIYISISYLYYYYYTKRKNPLFSMPPKCSKCLEQSEQSAEQCKSAPPRPKQRPRRYQGYAPRITPKCRNLTSNVK
jgi:hypothetical protein